MRTLPPPINLRGLLIDPPLFLAPMAGLTHSALRRVLATFGGVGLLSTEMLSAKRLPSENPSVSPFLVRTASERPLSYQLLTSRPEEVAPAIDALHALGADAVDVNMGCPAPSVGRFGAGFGLMEAPGTARLIVAEARRRTGLPVTAKIRIGTDLDDDRLRSFCRMLEGEGIDMLSVHARLKHESFDRRPRWEHIARMKEWTAVPVVANGGIFSADDALHCFRVSGADGLMIGRGAAVRPWLFAEIGRTVLGRAVAPPQVSLPAVYDAFAGHLELFRQPYRLGRLKQFTHYFARNFPFGHHLAAKVQSSGSVDEALERAGKFFERAAGSGRFPAPLREGQEP